MSLRHNPCLEPVFWRGACRRLRGCSPPSVRITRHATITPEDIGRARENGVESPQETSTMSRVSSSCRGKVLRRGQRSAAHAHASELSRVISKRVYLDPILSLADRPTAQTRMVCAVVVPACVQSFESQSSSKDNDDMKFLPHTLATTGCSLAAGVRKAESRSNESLGARQVTLREIVCCVKRDRHSVRRAKAL